ncbi:MAG: heme-binding domain-containing protein [Chlorobium sp.]|uniref:heme-binding domain-containing protein n=1 Tax=Chlorobium sp. TaxID=1095 RepID=UPI002F4132C4
MNIGKLATGAIIVFAAIQVIPYGRDHRNPPVTSEPSWDSPGTRELFFRACRDCHSNETDWPWYSNIAPASWLAQIDVNIGREKFNVSEWGRKGKNEGDEAAEEVRRGKMPPWFYLPAHPEAKLDDTEKEDLVRGLVATFGEKKQKNDEKH